MKTDAPSSVVLAMRRVAVLTSYRAIDLVFSIVIGVGAFYVWWIEKLVSFHDKILGSGRATFLRCFVSAVVLWSCLPVLLASTITNTLVPFLCRWSRKLRSLRDGRPSERR